jgi:MtfA peptidase
MFEWILGRRKKLYDKQITHDEKRLLEESLWQSRYLSSEQQDHLIRWSRVFLSLKNWEGCNGQAMDDSVTWSISASAGLMVLAYPEWYFDKTQSILVYPTPYVAKVDTRDSFVTHSTGAIMGEFYRAGETIYRGPVILNWRDLNQSRVNFNHGHHLAVHEFAHQLDMINSPFADGLPPLPDSINEMEWKKAMKDEFEEARQMVANGYRVLINDYGLSSESEFFAVASEYFFQMPRELSELHPNVYELLLVFYQVDLRRLLPAAWS